MMTSRWLTTLVLGLAGLFMGMLHIKRPTKRPQQTPIRTSIGPLRAKKAILSPVSKAMPRQTENPVMANTSSMDEPAMMRVGIPLSLPYSFSYEKQALDKNTKLKNSLKKSNTIVTS
jgi:hypothetical protein